MGWNTGARSQEIGVRILETGQGEKRHKAEGVKNPERGILAFSRKAPRKANELLVWWPLGKVRSGTHPSWDEEPVTQEGAF
jgi:hypothetical protein